MTRCLCVAPFIFLLAACGRAPQMPPNAGRYDLGDKVLASLDNPAGQAAAGETKGATIPSAPPKRIIHNATLALRVDDFSIAERQIVKLVREANGYVAEFRQNRVPDKRTSGTWVARIPVDVFSVFLDQLDQVGVAENKQIDSREVTEEYVDLKSRLASKQRIEQRVTELLEKRAGDVRDVIAIETELGRVHEEAERIEGRLRYLADRTDMTTVTISVHETQDYTPVPTTLAGRVSGAFNESLTALLAVGESVLIVIVACSPWAVVALLFSVPVGFAVARKRRQRR